ncbi:sulfatase-like hydrolase/transferase [Streptomyces sp. NPDC059849]|uniref:sulfatase n=1 Tax=Streptomyces sp. NPDC059849 TaxID=3346969 RepID=UPI0036556CDD
MRIIYVDVDTLRADHTTPYGYHRPTTPHLRELADKSVTFDRYYCSDSPCLPSRTALISGQFGITNGVIGHVGPAAQFRLDSGHGPEPDRPLLGQWLGWGGYYTAAVSVFAERHRAYFFHGNFRESHRATDRFGDEPAEDVNRVAIDWIRRHAEEEDWYLHVTYWDPHTNYIQPAEWTEKMAATGPVQEWPDEETIAAHAEIYGPRSALDLRYTLTGSGRSPVPHNMPDAIRSRADFEHLINGYDGAVHHWDHHFGRLMAALEELGIAEETAVIVSADHGESFGEQGSYAEHGLANEPTHRLPLILYWPGVTDRLPAEAAATTPCSTTSTSHPPGATCSAWRHPRAGRASRSPPPYTARSSSPAPIWSSATGPTPTSAPSAPGTTSTSAPTIREPFAPSGNSSSTSPTTRT